MVFRAIPLLLSLVLVESLGCGAAHRSPTAPVAPAVVARTAAAPEYELEVRIDPAQHELEVVGTVQTERPRTDFWLNEALVLDELADDDGPVAFRRDATRVFSERPLNHARFRYHGRLVREGERDFKSHAWILPTEVRLTEVTLWYPVFYDGDGDTPWPPEPVIGKMSVAPIEGLEWVSSGTALGDDRFEFREPSDLVLVGVPFERVTYPGEPTFEIVSPRHASLAPKLRATWDAHARRLGPGNAGAIHVVEFPATGAQNGLAFLSSNLIVLSSQTCDAIAEGTPRSQRVIAHEVAHRWFGGHLRPVGPGTRWLVESFAEHYASLFVRERLGDEEHARVIAELEANAGAIPVDVLSLGWTDDRVYSAGALGVRALADAVGQSTLDDAIRRIHENDLEWSVKQLVEQLGPDESGQIERFRQKWGLRVADKSAGERRPLGDERAYAGTRRDADGAPGVARFPALP